MPKRQCLKMARRGRDDGARCGSEPGQCACLAPVLATARRARRTFLRSGRLPRRRHPARVARRARGGAARRAAGQRRQLLSKPPARRCRRPPETITRASSTRLPLLAPALETRVRASRNLRGARYITRPARRGRSEGARAATDRRASLHSRTACRAARTCGNRTEPPASATRRRRPPRSARRVGGAAPGVSVVPQTRARADLYNLRGVPQKVSGCYSAAQPGRLTSSATRAPPAPLLALADDDRAQPAQASARRPPRPQPLRALSNPFAAREYETRHA